LICTGAKDSQAAINTLAEQGTISMGEMKGVNGEVVFLK
jgi:alpha-acetolactate decarboxylase